MQMDLDGVHETLKHRNAEMIIRWAAELFGEKLVMTSSFGPESAVMLHMTTRIIPQIQVLFIDTGEKFPETGGLIEKLGTRLKLNLNMYSAPTPLWETERELRERFGKDWKRHATAVTLYNQIRKLEPLGRALRHFETECFISGIRAEETEHRATLRHIEPGPDNVYKIHPILRWRRKEIEAYAAMYKLPLFPERNREERVLGSKLECGIHEVGMNPT